MNLTYSRFLDKWLFQGIFYDEFSEFGLDCDFRFLNSRDRLFWTDAYTTNEFPLDSSICQGGNFMAEIQKEVHNCGKSLNLLKLCQPSHFLCTSVVRKPKLRLLVSFAEVSGYKTVVINDPLGQTRSLASCDHYSRLNFVLFCEFLTRGDVCTRAKIVMITGRDYWSSEWIKLTILRIESLDQLFEELYRLHLFLFAANQIEG